MPFESPANAPRKIAVIGGGISGMGAAHALSATHNVTLIEAETRLGGHARTIIAGKRNDQPVDTGFIVFNKVNYPNLVHLFQSLGVPVSASDMSFGVSARSGRLEYALASLGALFAQRRNLLRPAFQRMVRDIFRFNATALAAARCPTLTIRDLLDDLGTGPWFRDYYLLPLSGAIWSTPTAKILDFPAKTLVQFLKNHGLLHHNRQHQWYTVEGGSTQYVTRLEAHLRQRGARLRLGTKVAGVRRFEHGAQVRMQGGEWETYDDVVFATHSDDTLALLSDPSQAERAALSAIAYQPNEVLLHADHSVMPRRRNVWSSWIYSEGREGPAEQIGLTYWMNSLQNIPADDPLFVTLNPQSPIREDLIYDSATFRHPVFDLAALEAQGAVRAFNGTNATWFCGAWVKNGFHEDGLASALDVADGINRIAAMPIAAE